MVGHIAPHLPQGLLQVVNLLRRNALPVNLEEPRRTGINAGIPPANLLAQRLFRREQRHQRPVVIVIRQQLLPAIPVFFIRIGGLNYADHHHLRRRLPRAAGGRNYAKAFAEGYVKELKAGGVHRHLNNDAVGSAHAVVIAAGPRHARPASLRQPSLALRQPGQILNPPPRAHIVGQIQVGPAGKVKSGRLHLKR